MSFSFFVGILTMIWCVYITIRIMDFIFVAIIDGFICSLNVVAWLMKRFVRINVWFFENHLVIFAVAVFLLWVVQIINMMGGHGFIHFLGVTFFRIRSSFYVIIIIFSIGICMNCFWVTIVVVIITFFGIIPNIYVIIVVRKSVFIFF